MQSIRNIKVLASFPSDVVDEASALDVIVSELNRTIGDAHGVRLEIINWLRDVRPGIGVDVQDVVNKQVGDLFDVIVATFWTRAGTPTPRAESGSIEEVKSAVSKSKKTGRLPFVLVYLKHEAVDVFQVDLAQMQTLLGFRQWLTENGVLYKPFQDRASFEAIVRVDLAKIATELARDAGESSQLVSVSANGGMPDEELGLLDYLDIQDEAFGKMGELLDDQTKSLETVTDAVTSTAAEMRQLSSNDFDRAALRRLLRKGSEAWVQFSLEAGARLLEFQKSADAGYDAIARAISLGASSGKEAREKLKSQLSSSVNSSKSAAESTKGYRDSVAGFPRMTSESNRAKRQMVDVLDRWIGQFERNASLAREIFDSLG